MTGCLDKNLEKFEILEKFNSSTVRNFRKVQQLEAENAAVFAAECESNILMNFQTFNG